MGTLKTFSAAAAALVLAMLTTATPQIARADNCVIDVATPGVIELYDGALIAISLSGCPEAELRLETDSAHGRKVGYVSWGTEGQHESWQWLAEPGVYRVRALLGGRQSQWEELVVAGPPSAMSAGTKHVHEATNTWGRFDATEPMTVWTEVRLGGRWSKSQQSTTTATGQYAIPLTYGSNQPGFTEWRVGGRYATGLVVYSEQFHMERVPRIGASGAPFKLVGESTNAWGNFQPRFLPADVWTEVRTPSGWSRSQIRLTDSNGGFIIPLTYGANSSGTTTWRVAGRSDYGTLIHSPEFTVRRVAEPTTYSALHKRVGEATNTWGSFDVDGQPVRVWTEVWTGSGWSKSQERWTTSSGSFVIPLTYGATSAGTTHWRVAGEYPEGVVRSGQFPLIRIR